jgi:hypothetical protein
MTKPTLSSLVSSIGTSPPSTDKAMVNSYPQLFYAQEVVRVRHLERQILEYREVIKTMDSRIPLCIQYQTWLRDSEAEYEHRTGRKMK